MSEETEYEIDGRRFRITAECADAIFGNGIRFSIYTSNGELWAKSLCNCHIEFEGFEKCQEMSTEQLLHVTKEKLINGWHQSIENGLNNGVQVLFRING